MRTQFMLAAVLVMLAGCSKSHDLSLAGGADAGADQDASGAGNGGSPGAGNGGNAGGGGTDQAGSGGDEPVDPEVALCMASTPSQVPDACSECACSESADCRTTIMECEDDCWQLIDCALNMCGGMDMNCVLQNCMQFFGGAQQAMAAADCLQSCPDDCNPDGGNGPNGDGGPGGGNPGGGRGN